MPESTQHPDGGVPDRETWLREVPEAWRVDCDDQETSAYWRGVDQAMAAFDRLLPVAQAARLIDPYADSVRDLLLDVVSYATDEANGEVSDQSIVDHVLAALRGDPFYRDALKAATPKGDRAHPS